MTRRNKGFTLIELMIVVAIIAIIAAIAIPSLLRSRIAANETSAQAALKQIVSTEGTWRQTDSDRNGAQDYWTLDVAGFYYAQSAAAQSLKFIDVNMAQADSTAVVGTYTAAGFPAAAKDKSGYFLGAIVTDENVAAYVDAAATVPAAAGIAAVASTNAAKYGFTAFPSGYNTTGLRNYIVNEQGVVYQLDVGTNPAVATAAWPIGTPDPSDPTTATPAWTPSE